MKAREMRKAQAALRLAIARAGGVSAMARALGITKGAVSQWSICPPSRVLDVERMSSIPRHDLRPDWYPEEDK